MWVLPSAKMSVVYVAKVKVTRVHEELFSIRCKIEEKELQKCFVKLQKRSVCFREPLIVQKLKKSAKVCHEKCIIFLSCELEIRRIC